MPIEIDIYGLGPFFKPGWVAMDANGRWCWFRHKPHILGEVWVRERIEHPWVDLSGCLAIEKATDWKKSLTKVGETK